MGDEVFAHDVAKRVLELGVLNKKIMLRVQTLGMLRRFEVEAQPLLNA
jgi:hypothetical protein